MVEWGRPDASRGPRLFMPAVLENPIRRGLAYFQLEGNFGKGLTFGFQAHDFTRIARYAWSATDPSMCPRTLQPRDRTLTEPDTFLLGYNGKD